MYRCRYSYISRPGAAIQIARDFHDSEAIRYGCYHFYGHGPCKCLRDEILGSTLIPFVKLYTHASLMFGNPCLGELKYEATTSAVAMAGLFLSWLVDYVSHRLAKHHAATKSANMAHYNDDVVNVLILEVGIIFHSICTSHRACTHTHVVTAK